MQRVKEDTNHAEAATITGIPGLTEANAKSWGDIRGCGDAPVATHGAITGHGRIIAAELDEPFAAESAQAWRAREISGGILESDYQPGFKQLGDRFPAYACSCRPKVATCAFTRSSLPAWRATTAV